MARPTSEPLDNDQYTIIFTNESCRRIIGHITNAGTADPDLINLRDAMALHLSKALPYPFMAAVLAIDDEILPGIRLSAIGMVIDYVIYFDD